MCAALAGLDNGLTNAKPYIVIAMHHCIYTFCIRRKTLETVVPLLLQSARVVLHVTMVPFCTEHVQSCDCTSSEVSIVLSIVMLTANFISDSLG